MRKFILYLFLILLQHHSLFFIDPTFSLVSYSPYQRVIFNIYLIVDLWAWISRFLFDWEFILFSLLEESVTGHIIVNKVFVCFVFPLSTFKMSCLCFWFVCSQDVCNNSDHHSSLWNISFLSHCLHFFFSFVSRVSIWHVCVDCLFLCIFPSWCLWVSWTCAFMSSVSARLEMAKVKERTLKTARKMQLVM